MKRKPSSFSVSRLFAARRARGGATLPCAEWAEVLIAAFDGEVDAQTAHAAQNHLRQCASCATRWEEWERTRVALRATPAPDAPSSLPARVFLSCRFASPAVAASDEQEPALFQSLSAYLQAAPDDLTVAPLADCFPEAPVPSHLKAAILQSTVGAAQAASKRAAAKPVPVWRRAWQERGLDWNAAAFKVSFNTSRAMRWGTALAVPAAAAWLFIAARTEYPVSLSPSEDSAPILVTETPEQESVQDTIAVTPRKSTPSQARALPGAPRSTVALPALSGRKVTGAALPAQPEPSRAPAAQPPVVNYRPSASKPTPAASTRRTNVRVANDASTPRNARVSNPVGPRAVPALTTTRAPRPRLQLATTSGTPVSIKRSGTNGGQSRVARAGQRVSAPVSAPRSLPFDEEDAIILAEAEMDEAWRSVSSLSDDRPEDLGRAIDEYRASLFAETSGGETL